MMKRERKNLFFQSLFLFHLLTATINENPTVYLKQSKQIESSTFLLFVISAQCFISQSEEIQRSMSQQRE